MNQKDFIYQHRRCALPRKMVVFKVNHHRKEGLRITRKKGMQETVINILYLLVGSFHLTSDDAIAKAVVVLVVLVATHDQHLHQGKLLPEALVQVLESLSDGSRGH